MTDDREDRSLESILQRLRFILAEPVDFTQTDAISTQAKIHQLRAAAIYFNVLAIADFGGRAGPERAPGLVEQVVAAAFQTYEGYDPHPDVFEKAAMLLRGITQGHPFNDGNKRTGLLTAAYYLRVVGARSPVPLPIDAAEALCVRISAGELNQITEIAEALRKLWRPPN